MSKQSNKDNDVLDILDDVNLNKKMNDYVIDELDRLAKYKANLEQTRYGDCHHLVVPYRELPPIVYVRDTLPKPPGDVQSGVLYILKSTNTKQYTAWIWDSSIGKFGAYVQVGDGEVGFVEWGNIHGDISEQSDLKEILDEYNNKINEIDDKSKEVKDLVESLNKRVSCAESSITLLSGSIVEINDMIDTIDKSIEDIQSGMRAIGGRIDDIFSDVELLKSNVSLLSARVASLETNKQDKLTPGENIIIDRNNVISAISTQYKPGDNITITEDGTISAKDTTYTAGEGISIDENNVISCTQESAEWGNIKGDISTQTDLIEKFNEVTTKIDVEKTERETSDNTLFQQIVKEVEDRESADVQLSTKIDNEVAIRGQEDTRIETKIDNEIENRKIADDNLSTLIDNEKQERINTDTALQTSIDIEAQQRASKDTELSDLINKEISDREDADTNLSQELSSEIVERDNADKLLQKSIDDEISDRQSADEVIQTALGEEISKRDEIDEALAESINDIKDLIPEDASKTNLLADRNYVDSHIIDIELATETKIGGIYASPKDDKVSNEVKIGKDGKLYNKQIEIKYQEDEPNIGSLVIRVGE